MIFSSDDDQGFPYESSYESNYFDEQLQDSYFFENSNPYIFLEDAINEADETTSDSYVLEGSNPNFHIGDDLILTVTQENNESIPPSQNAVPNLNPTNIKQRKRKPPTNLKPIMNTRQRKFLEDFYEHFTGNKNKKIRKEFIQKKIHPLLMEKLGLRKINRDETRNIGYYFMNFVSYDSKIMESIKEFEANKLINYQRDLPEFKDKKKK